jgi:hypothetical protein
MTIQEVKDTAFRINYIKEPVLGNHKNERVSLLLKQLQHEVHSLL